LSEAETKSAWLIAILGDLRPQIIAVYFAFLKQ